MVKASDISKSLKTTAEIISAVTAVVAVAGQLMDSVQPAIDGQQGKAVVEKTKDSLGQFKERIMSFKDSHEENRNQKRRIKNLPSSSKREENSFLKVPAKWFHIKISRIIKRKKGLLVLPFGPGFIRAVVALSLQLILRMFLKKTAQVLRTFILEKVEIWEKPLTPLARAMAIQMYTRM